MNVKSYDQILDSWSCMILKEECKSIEDRRMVGNYWIGIHDDPHNSIEKYVIDCFDFYLAKQFPDAVGLEWWFHAYHEDDKMLPFHVDCDENLRRTESRIVSPLISTVTYLNLHSSPTIILDMKQFGEGIMQFEPRDPKEAVISVPGEGKFLTFDSRYVHGVLPGNVGRYTLMYNVWNYKPETLNRIDYVTNVMPCHFFKCEPEDPQVYLGKQRCPCGIGYYGVEFMLRFPTITNNYETWIVKQ